MRLPWKRLQQRVLELLYQSQKLHLYPISNPIGTQSTNPTVTLVVEKTSNIGPIVGGIVGGIIVLTLIFGGAYFIHRL